MSQRERTGTTAFDRLRAHFDDVARKCPDCGYTDEDGKWQVTTSGDRVHYQHLCPSCGAVDSRELRLDQ